MSSTIPATVAWLFDSFTAAFAGAPLQVGQAQLLTANEDFLLVAFEDENTPAVTGAGSQSDYDGSRDFEEYDVVNQLSSWNGDADDQGVAVTAARAAVFGYFDTLISVLASAAPPSGIAQAVVGDFSLRHSIEDQGATATLTFVIHIKAWRTA